MNIPLVIAKELNIQEKQVTSVINLFGEGATVPFVARYRKEHTGGLDEDYLRQIEDRLSYLTILEERKQTVLKSIEEQGKLTDELRDKILAAVKLQEVEDLYLPYKPKRKTRGTIAKAKGLEPLALFILENPKFKKNFDEVLAQYVNPDLGVNTIEEALQGAKDIIAEMISETAEVRQAAREFLLDDASIVSSKADTKKEELRANKKDVYEVYHNFSCQLNKIKPYQLLAINRGEKEFFLKVILSYDKPGILNTIFDKYFSYDESVFDEILNEIVEDSFSRLIYPSIERD
ncbi:MAG: Tex-like N-terminal domain-containing protein, partial [Melioribacteraceae bacterium]